MTSGPYGASAFTSDFRHEYEAERERWLRRRFLWYTGIVSLLSVLSAAGAAVVLWAMAAKLPAGAASASWIKLGLGALATVPYIGSFFYARRRTGVSRAQLLRITYALILINGVLQLASDLTVRALVVDMPQVQAGLSWIASILSTHVFACLFLPWTPREAVRPLVPLLVLNAVFTLVSSDPVLAKVLTLVLSPVIAVPGALICWWRFSRFRDRFTLNVLRGRYAEMRHELHSARQIHESLFPGPITEGPVRFAYIYEPMRQIGGDYLYATQKVAPDGSRLVHLALLDVTGHGIPAALTVNRLHGELDRIFAENPGIGPGEVLTLLNRYVHLTLATHSVYVTALCFRVDAEADTLEYASGGHPPAFLRAVDGTIERLDSTALVLGAAAGPDFEPMPRTLRFGPGDALIAYTDGATEARDANGRYLGIAGIQGVIASGAPAGAGGWPSLVADAVVRHRHGPSADDTLVIEITRPFDSAPFGSDRAWSSAAVVTG
jgi:hypothetical protein